MFYYSSICEFSSRQTPDKSYFEIFFFWNDAHFPLLLTPTLGFGPVVHVVVSYTVQVISAVIMCLEIYKYMTSCFDSVIRSLLGTKGCHACGRLLVMFSFTLVGKQLSVM